jgi:hypothetical protein
MSPYIVDETFFKGIVANAPIENKSTHPCRKRKNFHKYKEF